MAPFTRAVCTFGGVSLADFALPLMQCRVQSREWHAEYPQPNSHDDVINTGILYATMAFDYEEAATVNLLLIGYDRTPNPLSGTATVTINICDVNDHPPVFEHSSYELSLREDATFPQSILQLRVCLKLVAMCPHDGRVVGSHNHSFDMREHSYDMTLHDCHY